MESHIEHTPEQANANTDKAQDNANQEQGLTGNGIGHSADPANSRGKHLANGGKKRAHSGGGSFLHSQLSPLHVQHAPEQADSNADEAQDNANQKQGLTSNGASDRTDPADSGSEHLSNGRQQRSHSHNTPFFLFTDF
ncbi:MAG: hypothetical protein DBY24_10420 [Prevotellaceae bacterium]|nr:MAG: hypothetical protein DBY24_10420 [Prevotellaceae bacterium]